MITAVCEQDPIRQSGIDGIGRDLGVARLTAYLVNHLRAERLGSHPVGPGFSRFGGRCYVFHGDEDILQTAQKLLPATPGTVSDLCQA
jgi:hypothetical protein